MQRGMKQVTTHRSETRYEEESTETRVAGGKQTNLGKETGACQNMPVRGEQAKKEPEDEGRQAKAVKDKRWRRRMSNEA